MTISVVLITYNGEKYIEKQLLSYLEQTTVPDEVVIVDDCSTDCTLNIIRNFINNHSINVKLFINDRNLGHNQNLAQAISKSSGDIIMLSDHDDVWFSEKISVLKKMLDENPQADMVFCCYRYAKMT